ncbi:MAG: hypothetical protein AAFN81_09530 [Bacteroidota bacterium]
MKKSFCGRLFWGLFLLFWQGSVILLAQSEKTPKSFQLPPELYEVSGLSVANTDSLWWHNDGGNAAELFLTTRAGEIRTQISLPTRNTDWEDLSHDDEGNLYLGDFGDNRRRRESLQIYKYDPKTAVLDSFSFHYEDHLKHDTEAFFWHRDTFHLFTKSRISRADLMTYHYVLPADHSAQNAMLRDSLPIRKRAVTAAAIHPETGTVALLAYYYKKRLGFIPYSAANVYFFNDYSGGYYLRGKMRSRRISFVVATQYESLDFLNAEELLVASERTIFIKPKAKRIKRR